MPRPRFGRGIQIQGRIAKVFTMIVQCDCGAAEKRDNKCCRPSTLITSMRKRGRKALRERDINTVRKLGI